MQRPQNPIHAVTTGAAGKPLLPVPISILDGMLTIAIKHQQQGRLPDAERIYRRILSLDACHAESLHMLGTLAAEVGRLDIAVELIGNAIRIDPKKASYQSNLGTMLQAQGKLEQAANAYKKALDRDPSLAQAYMNLGTVHQAQGKPRLAEDCFRAALDLRPDLAEAHMNLGNILQAQGQLVEAVESHDRALIYKPNFAEACFNRGNALQDMGMLDDAVASYRQALVCKPGLPEAHSNMGNALRAQNRLEDAANCYERALALKPDYAEAHYNLGNVRQAQDLLNEAADCYRRALALKPDLPEVHYNLGNTRQAQNDLEAAAICFARAIELRAGYAEAHYNLACVLQQMGDLEDALHRFAAAIELKQDYSQARFGHALALIQSGDFAKGWKNYESRWQSADHDTPRRAYMCPVWEGGRISQGRVLLWGEQGIGDEIMFAGMIPDALRSGNPIVLDCDERLRPLFARSFPDVEVVSIPHDPVSTNQGSAGQAWRPQAENELRIGAHLPTGSLAGIYRGNEGAFRATASPYLRADPVERERFRLRYADGSLLVGVAWHTRNRTSGLRRSIDLAELLPLFALPGIRWISLQYGDGDEIERIASSTGAPLLIDRHVDQLADIDLFAAQVAALDRVLTIDNSTAHLAGALGVPVWLMLPFAADWRWLRERADSPWYPTMRLFRQCRRGDWRTVVQKVRGSLQETLR